MRENAPADLTDQTSQENIIVIPIDTEPLLQIVQSEKIIR